MVEEFKDTMDLLNISFQAIEHPELVYKTSRVIQKAAFFSILGFLLTVAAIQISSGFEYFQFAVLAISALVIALVSLIYLMRGFFFFMGVETDRRQNGVLFANSVLAQQSDKAIANYQTYNTRVLRTHNPGPYPLYIILIIIAISLIATQMFIYSSGELLTPEMMMLFELISGFPLSMVTLVAIIILGTGVFGLGFLLFSNVGVKRWNSKSNIQMQAEAEKLVSTYSKGVEMTYEEGAMLLKDAENGNPAAVKQTLIMAEGMNREIARFKKVRIVYILAIITLSLIDILVFLLP